MIDQLETKINTIVIVIRAEIYKNYPELLMEAADYLSLRKKLNSPMQKRAKTERKIEFNDYKNEIVEQIKSYRTSTNKSFNSKSNPLIFVFENSDKLVAQNFSDFIIQIRREIDFSNYFSNISIILMISPTTALPLGLDSSIKSVVTMCSCSTVDSSQLFDLVSSKVVCSNLLPVSFPLSLSGWVYREFFKKMHCVTTAVDKFVFCFFCA
jgi:hypothetical protein